MPEASDKAAEKEVRRLRQLPENLTCPNCQKESEHGFGAICVPFKTFICDECKSAHQSFSHRTKSVAGSFWKMEEVRALDGRNGGGNALARKTWLGAVPDGNRPAPDASLEAKKRFVQKVYEERKWFVSPEDAVPKDDGGKEGTKECAAGRSNSGTESVGGSGGHSRRSRHDGEDREERRARRAARRQAREQTEEAGQGGTTPASVQSQVNWAPDTFAAPDTFGFETACLQAPDASSQGWGTDQEGFNDSSPASWAYPSRPAFDAYAPQPAVEASLRPRVNTDPTNPWAAEVEARMRQRGCSSESGSVQASNPSNPWAAVIRPRIESGTSISSSHTVYQGGPSQLLGQSHSHRSLWNVTACA